MARQIKAGTVDVSVVIRIVDSADGTPETGVVAATGGLVLEYRRELAASVSLATIVDLAALTTAHTDKGIKHIGNGYYRLDLVDAACAAGVTGVLVHGVVTGMVVIGEYIELVAYDPADGVRLGLTALPNAAADAAGGLPISDAGGLDLDAQRSDVAAILTDTGTTLQAELDGIQADVEDVQARLPAALVGGRIDATVDGTGLEATAAAVIADAVWDEVLADHLTAGTTGNALNAAGSAGDPWATALPGAYGAGTAGRLIGRSLPDIVAGAAGGLFIAGSNAATTCATLTVTGAFLVSGGTTFSHSTGTGFTCASVGSNGNGVAFAGNGTGAGLWTAGGATGSGIRAFGGGTSGAGVSITTTSGDGLSIVPTAGHAIIATANGTSKHGFFVTGGTAGTSDGFSAVAGTGGVPIRGNITGNLVGTVSTLTTYTGNTPQTGDAFARLGAPAGASVSADVAAVKVDTAAILVDTVEIGAAGAGLTAIPWNAAWDAEVQSEATDALNAYDPPTNAELEARTLAAASYATAASLATVAGYIDTEVAAIIVHLTDIKGATWSAVTDSLEALRDRGDTAWVTATGFSTHSAADVWAAGTRTLTAATNITSTGGTTVPQTGDAYAVVNSGTHGNAALKTLIDTVDTVIDAVLADTGTDGVVLSSATREAIATSLLDLAAGVETNRTLRQALRLILATAVGKLSGGGTSTVTIRDTNDSVNRVVATCDASGNRSSVTLDAG